MPPEGIGIGIDEDAIITLMRDLSIKPDRAEFLINLLASGQKTGNPADELQRFIANSTKANEVSFLAFLCGFGYGIAYTAINLNSDVKKVIKTSMIIGATHADEIKNLVNLEQKQQQQQDSKIVVVGSDNPDELQKVIDQITKDELGIVPEKKKKDEPQDDPMYR